LLILFLAISYLLCLSIVILTNNLLYFALACKIFLTIFSAAGHDLARHHRINFRGLGIAPFGHDLQSQITIGHETDQLQTRTNRRSAGGLHHPKKVQDDEYDGDNDQNVNPTACFREAWTDPPTEKPEQPQDE
jgi:hypothetical protein